MREAGFFCHVDCNIQSSAKILSAVCIRTEGKQFSAQFPEKFYIFQSTDVVFALRGISPELCVEEAMRGMLRRKTIIVPSALMRAATTAQRFMPMAILMPIMAHQQKKKLG